MNTRLEAYSEKTLTIGVFIIMTLLTVFLATVTHAAWLAPLLIAIGCVLYYAGYEEVAAPLDDHTEKSSTEEPLTVIREQYVRGEIDEKEFERRMEQVLESETAEKAREYRDRELSTETE
jgi:uncharacterized membrane protein